MYSNNRHCTMTTVEIKCDLPYSRDQQVSTLDHLISLPFARPTCLHMSKECLGKQHEATLAIIGRLLTSICRCRGSMYSHSHSISFAYPKLAAFGDIQVYGILQDRKGLLYAYRECLRTIIQLRRYDGTLLCVNLATNRLSSDRP